MPTGYPGDGICRITGSSSSAGKLLRGVTEAAKLELVGLFLKPFKARLIAINPYSQSVFMPYCDLAGPQRTSGAIGEAQHDLCVVVK